MSDIGMEGVPQPSTERRSPVAQELQDLTRQIESGEGNDLGKLTRFFELSSQAFGQVATETQAKGLPLVARSIQRLSGWYNTAAKGDLTQGAEIANQLEGYIYGDGLRLKETNPDAFAESKRRSDGWHSAATFLRDSRPPRVGLHATTPIPQTRPEKSNPISRIKNLVTKRGNT